MAINYKFEQIESDYDAENDCQPDGPPVTWAEKAIHDEVVRLRERIEALENSNQIKFMVEDEPRRPEADNETAQALTDRAEAMIQLANKALSKMDEDHLPTLFNQIYRSFEKNETDWPSVYISIQDHDANVTPFVCILQSDIDKRVLTNRITSHLIDENFTTEDLQVLWKIVCTFKGSEDSKTGIPF